MNEQAFIASLDRNPSDWETRLIYADWLEEAGREWDAVAQRYMGTLKKTPDVGNGLAFWSHVNIDHCIFRLLDKTKLEIGEHLDNIYWCSNRLAAESALTTALRLYHAAIQTWVNPMGFVPDSIGTCLEGHQLRTGASYYSRNRKGMRPDVVHPICASLPYQCGIDDKVAAAIEKWAQIPDPESETFNFLRQFSEGPS